MSVASVASSISGRALLVDLSISTWAARKYDKKLSQEVSQRHGVSDDTGRYNKFLLGGVDARSYKQLMSLSQGIRANHYTKTLPWTDEGWRLLPTSQYMEYISWYRDRKGKFDLLFDQFKTDYPSIRAKQTSNSFFNPRDYPVDIEGKFGMRLDIRPVAIDGDIRLNLGQEAIEEIEKSIRERVEMGIKIAVQDAWDRLRKVTQHYAEQCRNPDTRLFSSMIENTKDVCDALTKLNITDDPDLEAVRAEVDTHLASQDIDDLRDDSSTRADVARKAQEILRKMSEVYGVRA